METSEESRWEFRSTEDDFRYQQWVEDSVLIGELEGSLEEASAEAIIRLLKIARKSKGQPLRWLIVLSSLASVTPDARRRLTEFLTAESTPVERIAVFGGSFLIRNIFNLFRRISTVPARAFETREEAIRWARSDAQEGIEPGSHGL